MKILFYQWKAYNYRDIIHTFRSMGHEVGLISQELTNYDEDPVLEQRLEEKIMQNQYELVFTVNYFALISKVCEKCGIKYVIWTCDNPLISMYHKSIFNQCNYIFTFDRTNYLEFLGMGVKQIWYLPLAVNTERLDMLPVPEKMKAKMNPQGFLHDIAFVGSLYERNSYDRLEPVLPDYLKGYFDAVIQAQLNISGANIIEGMLTADVLEQLQEYFSLEKSKDSFSDLGLVFSTTVLGFKVAEVQRRKALLKLAKQFPVAVYTNSDTSGLFNARYCGSVDYWSEMPFVFRHSRINLNFTIPNIKSGIPLRVWDVLGAGGFLLTNFQAEIPMYFKEGEDLVCFDDEEDLIKKAGYYLEHEKERKEIAGNGYRKVKENHGYEGRITQMIKILEEHDGE